MDSCRYSGNQSKTKEQGRSGGESEAARNFQIARDKVKAPCKNLLTYWRKESHSLGFFFKIYSKTF